MTDEPLGSHVLELQVADVVKETDDARSLVFTVPDGVDIPADRLRYAPGQFLTLRVPSDQHRVGGALLLAVQLAVHRRSDDRDGQAHRRRLRLELAVRQRASPA